MSTLSTSTKPDPSPSASPVSATYPSMRRGSIFEESPFLSTSPGGSGSGNDSFAHQPQHQHQPPSYEGMTPSPSPPSAGLHYVQSQPVSYSQPGPLPCEARSAYGGHPGASQFYSLPPAHHALAPSAHPMPANGHHAHAQAHAHAHGAQPSRLDTLVTYHRQSPMMSPASASPLSAGLSTTGAGASYERGGGGDKRHERGDAEAHQLLLAQAQAHAQGPLAPEQAYRMGKTPGYMPRDAPF